MAYYTRRRGRQLWGDLKPFDQYGFCICCKNECSIGDVGRRSNNGSRKADRSFLCKDCDAQWESGALCELPRFKI